MKKIYTKEEEIAILTELFNADTYFHEAYKNLASIDGTKTDFEVMVENIEKDFPLDMGTSLDNNYHIAERNVVRLQEERWLDAQKAVESIAAKEKELSAYYEDIIASREAEIAELKNALRSARIESARIKLLHGIELSEHERTAAYNALTTFNK